MKKYKVFAAGSQCAASRFLYKENHSLGEWFKKAYGDENDKKTPFAIIEVRSAN
ncbi:hypothetical protein H6B51_09075, partial [Pseudoflavonifractor phocaeensis]|nr:hypothetical protein [Pseudoflavonifractor phocaeensis]